MLAPEFSRHVAEVIRRGQAAWRRRSWLERAAWLLWLLPILYFANVASSVTQVPAPGRVPADVGDRRFGVELAQRHEIYARIVDKDAQFHKRAERFKDAWSQADDYHIQLGGYAQALANEYDLHLSQVFLIYDEGLRAGWQGSDAKQLPASWPPLAPRIN